MYVGGTNFGFMNGANYHQKKKLYQPTITSYDYDAPVNESGDLNPIWYAIRDVLSSYTDVPELLPDFETSDVAVPPKSDFGGDDFTAESKASLFDPLTLYGLSHKVFREWTCTMEDLGQSYGYILYESWLPVYPDTNEFYISALHDYAYVYLGDRFLGTYERNNNTVVPIPPYVSTDQTLRLRILVENMGRINYGPQMINERKGITQGVYANERYLANWTMYTIPLSGKKVDNYIFSGKNPKSTEMGTEEDGPVFYKAVFTVPHSNDNIPDTFLDTSKLGKGVVFVNGVNVGRFWPKAGPQRFLYIPGVYLKKGNNNIVVLEFQPKGSLITLKFTKTPVYSSVQKVT